MMVVSPRVKPERVMKLVDDPQEAQRIWQEIKRRRYDAYLAVLNSPRDSRNWLKNYQIRRFRQGATDLWQTGELADIILDDGSYLDEVLCFGDYALGIMIGGHTGFLPFTDCEQIKGRRVTNFLKWGWSHAVPLVGRRLRYQWAQKMGVTPARPSWVPKI